MERDIATYVGASQPIYVTWVCTFADASRCMAGCQAAWIRLWQTTQQVWARLALGAISSSSSPRRGRGGFTGAPDYLLGQSSSFVSLSLGLGRPMLPSATSTGRSLTVLPGSTRGGRRAVPFRASTFRLRLKARAWGGSAPTTGDRFRQYRRRIGGADTGTEGVG